MKVSEGVYFNKACPALRRGTWVREPGGLIESIGIGQESSGRATGELIVTAAHGQRSHQCVAGLLGRSGISNRGGSGRLRGRGGMGHRSCYFRSVICESVVSQWLAARLEPEARLAGGALTPDQRVAFVRDATAFFVIILLDALLFES
ncbi:hypothetical protein EVAR_82516_1 [Eumeta japonica]|uniref:Uncharacterized protein n=1 Tax=Eumeta variegata TaxID=151549 RepID=A0A4C1UYB9_EUMVA|nr:hypothetical protein EVAR_82516_1 [Eumeta japonica]